MSRAADHPRTSPEPSGDERARRLSALAERIGHRFTDLGLLDHALAHRSWCAEHPGESSNERLEFLGDAVLGWMVADLVFRRHADLPEGKLTDLRKSVVNATALAQVARSLQLGPVILLGRGERGAGGGDKDSILADAFEAVLGAVYLDGGVAAASAMVERLFVERLEHTAGRLDRLDAKTALQEALARRGDLAPVYLIAEDGPEHQKVFAATVLVGGEPMGRGSGRSKKVAEQAAAAEALAALERGARAAGPAASGTSGN